MDQSVTRSETPSDRIEDNQMQQWCRVLFLVSIAIAIGSMEFDLGALAYAQDRDSTYIAPFVPTPQEVVDRMLELAQVDQKDVLYDLGSGDGRIVITAAKRYGARPSVLRSTMHW